MHEVKLLHRYLRNACPSIHAKQLRALMRGVEGLLRGADLTLTSLGRGLSGHAYPKYHIKAMDRLLGAQRLYERRFEIYRWMARFALGTLAQPVVVVDWSDSGRWDRRVLKAAVPLGGRAVTIYQEVYRLSEYKKPRVHRRFLRHLSEVILPGCYPIIVTDAGFHRSWFRQVEAFGWQWIGRVRGQVHYRLSGSERWCAVKQLHAGARKRARDLGWGELSKGQPYRCRFSVMRGAKRRRGDKPNNRRHGHGTVEKRCRKAAREPWVLASSLTEEAASAKQLMRYYALRMQIEETFRDIKDPRFGYGLNYTATRAPQRLEMLLLIGALAMLMQLLSGMAMVAKGWKRYFQANTERDKPTLSLFFLGRQLRLSDRFELHWRDLHQAAKQLPVLVTEQLAPA